MFFSECQGFPTQPVTGLLVCQGTNPQFLRVARLGSEVARTHELLSLELRSLNSFTLLNYPI